MPLTKAIKRSNRSSRRISTRLRSHPTTNKKRTTGRQKNLQGIGYDADPFSGDEWLIAATVIKCTWMPGKLGVLSHDSSVERRLQRLGEAAADHEVKHFDDRGSARSQVRNQKHSETEGCESIVAGQSG